VSDDTVSATLSTPFRFRLNVCCGDVVSSCPLEGLQLMALQRVAWFEAVNSNLVNTPKVERCGSEPSIYNLILNDFNFIILLFYFIIINLFQYEFIYLNIKNTNLCINKLLFFVTQNRLFGIIIIMYNMEILEQCHMIVIECIIYL
jgi:hypothetical protein